MQQVAVSSTEEALDVLTHHYRSLDMLALQASKSGDGVLCNALMHTRDHRLNEYAQLMGANPYDCVIAINCPNGMH